MVFFTAWKKEEQFRQVSILVLEKLPLENYKVLKYIISFLSRVKLKNNFIFVETLQK